MASATPTARRIAREPARCSGELFERSGKRTLATFAAGATVRQPKDATDRGRRYGPHHVTP